MYLPDQLQNQSFVKWNYTVKGLMRVWTIARKFQLDCVLDQGLRNDETGLLAQRLGELGNNPNLLAEMFRRCSRFAGDAVVPFPSLPPASSAEADTALISWLCSQGQD